MSSPQGRISASDSHCECWTPCRSLTHDCLSGPLQTCCRGLSLLSTPAVLGSPCWTYLQPLALIFSPDPETNSIHLSLKIHLPLLAIAAVPVLVQATAQSCHDYRCSPLTGHCPLWAKQYIQIMSVLYPKYPTVPLRVPRMAARPLLRLRLNQCPPWSHPLDLLFSLLIWNIFLDSLLLRLCSNVISSFE